MPLPDDGRAPLSLSPVPLGLSLSWEEDGRRVTLEGAVDALSEEEGVPRLTLARVVPCVPSAPPREVVRRTRGEAFALAHMYMEAHAGASAVCVCTVRVSASGEEHADEEERISRASAASFFARLRAVLGGVADFEVERVCRRLPTMAHFPFPYKTVRESQRDMMQAVYRAVKGKRRLYACAPTGTGKTAAALYPAVRAIGAGATDKVFYLTPKSTTAMAAMDAVARFRRAGAEILALSLTAKERMCCEGLRCRDPRTPCRFASAGGKREEEAAADLLARGLSPVGEEEIRETAARFGVCPYELSLRYSLFCDIVICDYNYLFDPRVFLRRYFSRTGNYTFLIDEAHDLADRAREMYSAELHLAQIEDFVTRVRDTSEDLAQIGERAAAAFRHTVAPLANEHTWQDGEGNTCAFLADKTPPLALCNALAALVDACEKVVGDRRLPFPFRMDVREHAYVFRDFLARQTYDTTRFETFCFRTGADYRVRTVCLDPSEVVDARLSCGRSAVLFSATLEPLEYYRTLLGGARGAEEMLLESPFDNDRLAVCIMDKISTRYADRSASAPAIAAAIAATVDARVGNYFVFCPSFAYLEEVARAFHNTRPHVNMLVQGRHASAREREAFLSAFVEDPTATLVGFCVTGGVYAEGIDLVGTRLIGAVVVGVGLPQPSPERDAMAAYYDDIYERGKEFAYVYPGMNRVLQAAGRVIRTENDCGTLVLIDDRLAAPLYRHIIPHRWRALKYVGDTRTLSLVLAKFWKNQLG